MAFLLISLAIFLVIFAIFVRPLLYHPQQIAFAQQQQQQLPSRPAASSQTGQQSNLIDMNKSLIKSFVQEVFNKHNLTALDKYYAPNVTLHNSMAGQGRQVFRQFFTLFFSAFPDIYVTVEHIVAENHVVLVFLNWTGTHKGEFQGIAPTNKPINMRTADLFRINNNNTIVEQWDVVDPLNLLKQIGALDQSKVK
jgi:predicted SnoaL-like aldol condensation-catalyzing enzyme